ncbi:MAG: SLC13 family permease [Solidesulfovibrio sp. DCME]|uniref:SLC13 family permease n=1 Tax=Solidesulfovibrio sp. DCME TaxID=3447380 RepID=UPI003D10DF90
MQRTAPDTPGRPPAFLSLAPRQGIALAAILAAGVALPLVPAPPQSLARPAIVVLLGIGLWTTGWLPEWLTALVFFSLCMMGKAAPPADVFAGFASSATWLVLSGAAIGLAIQHTGLGVRLASGLAPRIGRSFPRAVIVVTLFGLALTFAMPSAMGRVMLLLPILTALADRLGYRPGSKGRRGVLLAGIFGTYLPAFAVLPANIPNTVFMGTVEAALGAPLRYGAYLLLHFPVLGLAKAALLVPLLIAAYRDTPQLEPNPAGAPVGKASAREIHLAVVLVLAVGLWATDAWHGIPAAWIGMLVAVWCLFPGSGLTGKNPFSALKFEPIFYVAGIVSLGAVADHSGLGRRVANGALAVLPFAHDSPARTFGLLAGLSTLVGLVVTLPGVPPVMTSLTGTLATATGWSPQAVAMTQVLGFSTVILPYQAPPLVVAIQSGGLAAGDVARLCLVTAALTMAVLWPVDYAWWSLLGWAG